MEDMMIRIRTHTGWTLTAHFVITAAWALGLIVLMSIGGGR